jgi:alpha-ribazole phosphatase
MEIYLVRHTEVAISREYCYGISDVDLADSYEVDIRRVADKLKDIKFTSSYTSPLSRCKLLSNALVDNASEEAALLEMDLGDWELKKWKDLDQETVNTWMKDFVNVSPPNTINYLEYSMKPVFFFDEMVREHRKDETILLTSHSGAIRAIICHVLNLSLAHAFNFEVDYGSVSKIEVIDGWYKLKNLNC